MDAGLKIKYLREQNKQQRASVGNPIGCIVYKVVGDKVHYGVSVCNSTQVDKVERVKMVSGGRDLKKSIPDPNGTKITVMVRDLFEKKVARKLALDKLNQSPNVVEISGTQQTVLDVLDDIVRRNGSTTDKEQRCTIMPGRARRAAANSARLIRKAVAKREVLKRLDEVLKKLREVRDFASSLNLKLPDHVLLEKADDLYEIVVTALEQADELYDLVTSVQ